MYDFSYHRPTTLAAALTLLASQSEAKALSGGQTLLPAMKHRLAAPSDLIDLMHVPELTGIAVSPTQVSIGAAVRHAEVAAHAGVARAIPALAALAGGIGDPQVRHRGTLGGSIANNDPAADYPGALLGLGATVYTSARAVPADAFFTGMFATVLEPGELVVRVDFPVPQRAAYAKFPNPASRYAVVGVFVAQTADGVRVAVTGAAPCAYRQIDMEAALTADFRPEALAEVVVASDNLNSDLHASADYRAHLVGVMARRAVAAALTA